VSVLPAFLGNYVTGQLTKVKVDRNREKSSC